MRLDDIKARAAAAQAPDEEWVTEIAVQSHHIDLMENARTDVPLLLAVAEAAAALDRITDEWGHCSVCYTSWDEHAPDCAWVLMRAALAELLADDTGSSVSRVTESASTSTKRPDV